jgi:hypothetical protein
MDNAQSCDSYSNIFLSQTYGPCFLLVNYILNDLEVGVSKRFYLHPRNLRLKMFREADFEYSDCENNL